MEDFYVYLPSTSSKLYFPDNTPSNFATQLSRRINLPVPYECSVTQIQYLHIWDTFEENSCSLTYTLNEKFEYFNDSKAENFVSITGFIKYIDSLQIPFFSIFFSSRNDTFIINWRRKGSVKINGTFLRAMGFGTTQTFKFGDTVSTESVDYGYFKESSSRKRQNDVFTFEIQNTSNLKDQVLTLPVSHYARVEDLLIELNKLGSDIDKINPPFTFTFNRNKNKVFVNMTKSLILTLSKELARLLGINELKLNTSTEAENSPSINSDIFTFYIYSDIVSSCLIGNTEAPLLEAFQPSGKSGELVTERFTIRNYKHVSKRSFESILIQIRDGKGRLIPFNGGFVLVTLHFKVR